MSELKKHNPSKLSAEQIGTAEGWRLLDEDEYISGCDTLPLGSVEQWREGKWVHDSFYCSMPEFTYRTKLSRAELRKARGLPEEPAQISQDARSFGHANQLSDRVLNDGVADPATLARQATVGGAESADGQSGLRAIRSTEIAGVAPRPEDSLPDEPAKAPEVSEIARAASIKIVRRIGLSNIPSDGEGVFATLSNAITEATAAKDAEIAKRIRQIESIERVLSDVCKSRALKDEEIRRLKEELSAVRLCFAEASHAAGPEFVAAEMKWKQERDALSAELECCKRLGLKFSEIVLYSDKVAQLAAELELEKEVSNKLSAELLRVTSDFKETAVELKRVRKALKKARRYVSKVSRGIYAVGNSQTIRDVAKVRLTIIDKCLQPQPERTVKPCLNPALGTAKDASASVASKSETLSDSVSNASGQSDPAPLAESGVILSFRCRCGKPIDICDCDRITALESQLAAVTAERDCYHGTLCAVTASLLDSAGCWTTELLIQAIDALKARAETAELKLAEAMEYLRVIQFRAREASIEELAAEALAKGAA